MIIIMESTDTSNTIHNRALYISNSIIDSKEKRAHNMVPGKIQTRAKISNVYVMALRQLKLLKIVQFYYCMV